MGVLAGQAYTPKTLLRGQIDASSVQSLAAGIVMQARATTPREKAEAIWRFFLTDGRYVQPGFWYHLGGWAYEEPKGEVLDAVKLLNSYGFGLCYHIAPLLEAIYEAAGFADARVWFLTGHTVTEVFYDGAYHYFDSDMMGYNPTGKGRLKERPIASVQEIAADPKVMLGRVDEIDPLNDPPFYPADRKAGAMPQLAALFSSQEDNWLFPFTRYAQGHSMEFVLRPGERLIRYFGSEEGTFYLPHKREADEWKKFPLDIAEYKIRVVDGPRSLTDTRDWGTGRLEYQPPLGRRSAYRSVTGLALSPSQFALPAGGAGGSAVFEIRSPYVLIDAAFAMSVALPDGAEMTVKTSTDNGMTWDVARSVKGPLQGKWDAAPKVLARAEPGSWNAVSGTYGYLLRFDLTGPGSASIQDLRITSRFQYNRRVLAPLQKGKNELLYEPGPMQSRWELPVRLDAVEKIAARMEKVRYVSEDDQGMLVPEENQTAEIVFEVAAPDGAALSAVDAGGRFLDLRNGLAPEKRTAETRQTKVLSAAPEHDRAASLEWSLAPDRDFQTLWTYDPKIDWKDGKPYAQALRWPEVDRKISALPAGTQKVYVKYRLRNVALDDVRLAVTSPRAERSPLEVIHVWFEDGKERSHVERIEDPSQKRAYTVNVGAKAKNYGLIYSCPVGAEPKN